MNSMRVDLRHLIALIGLFLSGTLASCRSETPVSPRAYAPAAADEQASAAERQSALSDASSSPVGARKPSGPMASQANSRQQHGTGEIPEDLPQNIKDLELATQREVDRLADRFPNDPDALEVKAQIYYLLGMNEQAATFWQEILKLNPQYAYAYHGLGLVASRRAEYERAAELQRKALEIMPQLTEAAYQLAEVLLKQGKVDEAVGALEQFAESSPPSTTTLVHLGLTYAAAQQYEKARDALQEALSRYDNIPEAQFALANTLRRLGQTQEALELVKRYRETQRGGRDRRETDNRIRQRWVGFAQRYVLAARVYLAHGVVREAERLCRWAAQLSADNTDARVMLATIYQQTGRSEEALAMCRELVTIAPDNPVYHLNLGMMYRNLKRFDEAEACFRRVNELAPQRPEGHVALARLYLLSQENFPRAVAHAEKAVSLGQSAANYALLAQAYAVTGNRNGAVRAMEQAVTRDPDNGQYQQALAQLRALQESSSP